MKGDDAHGDDGVDSTTDVEGWCGRDWAASGEDTVVVTASSSSLLPATVPPFLAPDPEEEEEKMRWR
jgi:hypothetical protein